MLRKIKNKIDGYPTSFYSFRSGSRVSDKEIKEMLVDVAESLKTTDNAYSATGDTIVFGYRYQEGDKYEYELNVAKNYHTITIHDLSVFQATDADPSFNAPVNFFDI